MILFNNLAFAKYILYAIGSPGEEYITYYKGTLTAKYKLFLVNKLKYTELLSMNMDRLPSYFIDIQERSIRREGYPFFSNFCSVQILHPFFSFIMFAEIENKVLFSSITLLSSL